MEPLGKHTIQRPFNSGEALILISLSLLSILVYERDGKGQWEGRNILGTIRKSTNDIGIA